MKNLINKKTYQIFIFSFVFIILSLFNINKVSAKETPWWYLGTTGKIYGVDGINSPLGFKDKTSCEKSRADYIKELESLWWEKSKYLNMENIDTSSVKPSDCFQKEATDVEKEIQKEKDKLEQAKDKYLGISPGDSPLSTAVSPIYKLLAPIGKITQIETNSIGVYFNILFKIAIGLCAALAVIMLVIYGIAYMGEESVFGKANAKDKMTSALLGLGLALGSYVLLNTIDPSLTGKGGVRVDQVEIIIDLPDVGDNTIDPNFKTGKGKYSTSTEISSGVKSAVEKLKNGWSINQFRIYPNNNRMLISLKKGSEIDNSNVISILPGTLNYSEKNLAKTKDNKTPKGDWKIIDIRTPGGGKPVYSSKGSNMGPTFWLLNPMSNGERGIGIHGSEKGGLTSKTNGCIRMKNSDLLALLPYVKTGIRVFIGD
jgi:hypothetical protein